MITVTFDPLTHKVGLIKPTDAMIEAAPLSPNEAVLRCFLYGSPQKRPLKRTVKINYFLFPSNPVLCYSSPIATNHIS